MLANIKKAQLEIWWISLSVNTILPVFIMQRCLMSIVMCSFTIKCQCFVALCFSGLYKNTYHYFFFILACDGNSYGANCSLQCGKCMNNTQCHHAFGNCMGGCASGFNGTKCDTGIVYVVILNKMLKKKKHSSRKLTTINVCASLWYNFLMSEKGPVTPSCVPTACSLRCKIHASP